MGTLTKCETVSLISLHVLRVVRTLLNPRMLSSRRATLAENLRNVVFAKITSFENQRCIYLPKKSIFFWKCSNCHKFLFFGAPLASDRDRQGTLAYMNV